jgi:hypothetical protein
MLGGAKTVDVSSFDFNLHELQSLSSISQSTFIDGADVEGSVNRKTTL